MTALLKKCVQICHKSLRVGRATIKAKVFSTIKVFFFFLVSAVTEHLEGRTRHRAKLELSRVHYLQKWKRRSAGFSLLF